MKITRGKLLQLWGLMNTLLQKRTSVKFHYLMLRNKKLLESEVESVQKTQSSLADVEGRDEFNNKRLALCEEYAEKEESGKPKVLNDSYVIDEERKKEFDEKLTELKEEYKTTIEALDNNQADFYRLLDEELEVDLVKIPASILPQDIDAAGYEVELFFDLIDDQN